MFQLTVQFMGSGRSVLPLGEHTDHESALKSARTFVEFLRSEHKANNTKCSFDIQIQSPDVIAVIKNNNLDRFHPSGLYLVLKINEVPEEVVEYGGTRPIIAKEKSYPERWEPRQHVTEEEG